MNLMQFYYRYYKYDWNNNIYCHLWHCLGWAILDFCHQSLFLWNISISGPTLLQFCNIYCFVSEFWILCFFLSINTNSHGNSLFNLSLQNKTEKPFSTNTPGPWILWILVVQFLLMRICKKTHRYPAYAIFTTSAVKEFPPKCASQGLTVF